MNRIRFVAPLLASSLGSICAAIPPCAAAETTSIAVKVAPPVEKDPMESSDATRTNYEHRAICQPQTVIGSRIPRMVCRTQAQMDARRVADQAWKDETDRRQYHLPAGPGMRSSRGG